MPPADEKPALVRVTGPSTYRKPQSVCQECATRPGTSTSSGILLVNFELPYRENRAITLRARGHKVLVPEEHGTSLWEITGSDLQQIDLVLCDLTRVNYDTWRELRRICRFRKHDRLAIMAICSSRTYRGAEFELLVEKELETRLVHAQ